jgi:hypothetical protein
MARNAAQSTATADELCRAAVFFGYLDASRSTAMIKAWTGLMSLIAPDLIIANHAPTALIAARVLGIPRARLARDLNCRRVRRRFPTCDLG